jgi:hypothetical protein
MNVRGLFLEVEGRGSPAYRGHENNLNTFSGSFFWTKHDTRRVLWRRVYIQLKRLAPLSAHFCGQYACAGQVSMPFYLG